MWISSREMSEQRRAWLAFSSLARPVHYWADALVFVETKRGGHERAEPTTVREHDRGRDREGSEENAGYQGEKRRLPSVEHTVGNTKDVFGVEFVFHCADDVGVGCG
jgi:hypothetical protein